jgi:hypothetical protein
MDGSSAMSAVAPDVRKKAILSASRDLRAAAVVAADDLQSFDVRLLPAFYCCSVAYVVLPLDHSELTWQSLFTPRCSFGSSQRFSFWMAFPSRSASLTGVPPTLLNCVRAIVHVCHDSGV